MLEVFDLYADGIWTPNRGYLWITVIDNISITVRIPLARIPQPAHRLQASLSYLILFYIATKEELDPYQPIPKFLAVKIVIFFSFWCAISMPSRTTYMRTCTHVSVTLHARWTWLSGGRRQGVLISILSAIGFIHDVGQFKTVNVSAGVQDFLICIEMAAVAIWHHWAFAFEPYRDPTKQPFFKDIRRTI